MSSYSRVYDFSIPANGTIFLEVPGDYYKIIANTGNIGTRRDGSNVLQPMYAGRGEKGAVFQRLAMTDLSGSINIGQILIASGAEMVDTTLQLVGAVQVRPESHSGSFSQNGALTVNTAELIFSAASNSNGAIVLSADLCYFDGTTSAMQAFVAKASAPASVTDGVLILCSKPAILNTVTGGAGALAKEQSIPAGFGLYHIANGAIGTGITFSLRACRFKLL